MILPTPWYFNHKMWLDMAGVTAVPLPHRPRPDPRGRPGGRALITPRTRAIVLVSPNNPGGAEYPAETLRAFLDLARAHGLALIVDETYRDFDSRTGRPHDLFADPDWADTLIHLYSFSKAYRLTGHRVGAIVAGRGPAGARSRSSSTPSPSARASLARSARSGGCATSRNGSRANGPRSLPAALR